MDAETENRGNERRERGMIRRRLARGCGLKEHENSARRAEAIPREREPIQRNPS